jgi:hypothetical protein
MTTRRPAAHLGALLAEEPAHHRGVGFDPSLGRQAIAESLKRCASVTSNPR